MSTFAEALARNPAPPRTLGDVSLKYDPPILVGSGVSRSTVGPLVALVSGTGFGLASLAGFIVHLPPLALGALIVAAGASFIANVFLERRAVRRRTFVIHFADKTLRLDTATQFRGRPRTMIADFEKVTAVEIVETLAGTLALTVSFVPAHGPPQLRQEALIAFVLPAQRPELERVQALLARAFGPSPKSAAAGAGAEPELAAAEPVDSFSL